MSPAAIAIARRLVKLHTDTPKHVGHPLGIPHPYPLLGHVPGLDTAHGAQRTPDLIGKALMLAGNETSPRVSMSHRKARVQKL